MNNSDYRNPWTYQGEIVHEISDEFIGFVYCITEKSTGKKYIGKKGAKRKKTLPKNSRRKKKEVTLIDSDWRKYYGSSNNLKESINENVVDDYDREILRFCVSKGEMTYFEIKEQIDREVLFRDDYYNDFVGGKIRGSWLKHLKQKQTKTTK